jgi:putative glutamine amidotransferase
MTKPSKPRIAIPIPLSRDAEYSARAIPQYVKAVEAAGGEAVVIPLDKSPSEIARIASDCQGALLPGSAADVDTQKYDEPRGKETNDPDPARDTVDELLIQDAYNMRKPLFGICYGMQNLNVWHTGSLVQHVISPVNHTAGRAVAKAHHLIVNPATKLAEIIAEAPGTQAEVTPDGTALHLEVNSSHHQAVKQVGSGLRVAARCEEDNLIEAIEDVTPDHWVLGVQWHPERNYENDAVSQALFNSFIDAARKWKPQPQKP